MLTSPQLEDSVNRFFSRENVDKYYDLKKEIGSGNFSIVKLAVNKKTGEEVAVKIIEKKRVGTKKEMLQTEVDILQKVHHPHVVSLKEMFETSTHIYLVMELCVPLSPFLLAAELIAASLAASSSIASSSVALTRRRTLSMS